MIVCLFLSITPIWDSLAVRNSYRFLLLRGIVNNHDTNHTKHNKPGPMTPPGKRVQTINPPGSEVGPGGIAIWGKSLTDEADAMGFKWERKGKSSKHIRFEWNGP